MSALVSERCAGLFSVEVSGMGALKSVSNRALELPRPEFAVENRSHGPQFLGSPVLIQDEGREGGSSPFRVPTGAKRVEVPVLELPGERASVSRVQTLTA